MVTIWIKVLIDVKNALPYVKSVNQILDAPNVIFHILDYHSVNLISLVFSILMIITSKSKGLVTQNVLPVKIIAKIVHLVFKMLIEKIMPLTVTVTLDTMKTPKETV